MLSIFEVFSIRIEVERGLVLRKSFLIVHLETAAVMYLYALC